MAKKKPIRKKKSSPAPKAKTKKKLTSKASKPALKKPARSKKAAPAKKQVSAKKPVARKKQARSSEPTSKPSARIHQGVGLMSGGQSGDTQGLSNTETADSESVVELAEEGQDYEAEVISGVENALDPDQSEVTTKEVPEDDVPPEYRNQD